MLSFNLSPLQLSACLASESTFMRSLEEFDKDNIPDSVIKKLKK